MALLGKNSTMDSVALWQKLNHVALLNYRSFGSFSSDYVPTLFSETFVIITRQPRFLQEERSIMVANFCHKLSFADFQCLEKYTFRK